jgi:hypothetical protein
MRVPNTHEVEIVGALCGQLHPSLAVLGLVLQDVPWTGEKVIALEKILEVG